MFCPRRNRSVSDSDTLRYKQALPANEVVWLLRNSDPPAAWHRCTVLSDTLTKSYYRHQTVYRHQATVLDNIRRIEVDFAVIFTEEGPQHYAYTEFKVWLP